MGPFYDKKVFVGNDEVHRTKVVPMALSPIWDDTFIVSYGTREQEGDRDRFSQGLCFEIWDHDTLGAGDYLGASVARIAEK